MNTYCYKLPVGYAKKFLIMNKYLVPALDILYGVQALICLMSSFDNGGTQFWGESIKVRFSFLNPSTNFVGIKKRCKNEKKYK